LETPNGNKILIVDDSPYSLLLLSEILTDAGYMVLVAQNGMEAMRCIEKEMPTLILLDIMMPEMDGFEVCRQIKSSQKFGNIPVIFLSALNDNESKIKGFNAGGVDYISKPIHNQEVLARVNAHINLFNLQQKLQEKNEALESEIRSGIEKKEALELSESKYRYLFENNPQPLWIYDLETLAFLNVNKVAINHYGYSKDEFLSMTLKDIRPKNDVPTLLDDVKNTFNEYNQAGTWKHLKKNGELIDVEIHSHLIVYEGRKARLVLASDVTERVKAEVALTESVQLFQGLFNVSPDSIILIDPHDQNTSWPIVDCNIAACKMNGYTRDELIGKSIDILNADDQTRQDHDNYFANLKEAGSKFIKTYHRHKNGHIFPIEVLTSIITLGDREYILGIDRDITDKKKAEEDLKIFKMGIDNAEDPIFVTDTDGSIKFVNPAFERVYGYSFDEVVGKTPRIIKSGLLKQENYKEFWDTLLSRKVISEEITNKRKDGSFVTIEGSNTPILNDAGDIIGFLSIHRDITEKKKAQEELVLAKNKAEESDRLKSAFLANMSHEIRTPLNCILGFSELLTDPDLDNDQRTEFNQLIEISGKNLLSIINDIVDISKIEAGQLIITKNKLLLRNFIEYTVKEFEAGAHSKGVELIIAPNSLPKDLVIETDESRVKQVLSNLISNALKFTEKGTIEIGIIKLTGFVQFYVKDTGIGIPEDIHGYIFERFRQGENAHTRKYGGNGLGLAISKNLVNMLGGTIGLKSELGKGSTFWFTLPV
jgi:PAS domain S-box-containing protein